MLLILPQVGGEDAEPPLVLGPGVVFLPELLPELGELELVLIRAVKEGPRRFHSAWRRPLLPLWIFFNQTARYDLFGQASQFQIYLLRLNACLEKIMLVSSFNKEKAIDEAFFEH